MALRTVHSLFATNEYAGNSQRHTHATTRLHVIDYCTIWLMRIAYSASRPEGRKLLA